VAGGGTLNETEIDEGLDEEFVMTWMGLILRDCTTFDDEQFAQALQQLVHHLNGHIHTAKAPDRSAKVA